MKKLMLLVALVSVACFAQADDDAIYVAKNDPNAGDTPIPGRGSEALPYRTLQVAINAAPAGSTIKVKPGVYDEGETMVDIGGNYQTNRVVITKKLYLVSTEGKEKTTILGKFGTNGSDPQYKLGTDSIRPVYITGDGADSIIEGFTIANGATIWAGSGGGGVYARSCNAYLVDSVVTNCMSASAGGIYGVTAVRCLISGNSGRSRDSSDVHSSKLWNCIVIVRPGNAEHAVHECTAVNCTIIAGTTRVLKISKSVLYNCLSCSFRYDTYNAADNISECASTNTLYTKDFGKDKKICVSPLFGDVRILSNSQVNTAQGEAKYVVGDEAIIQLPAGIAATDYTGNDLTGKTGTIHCGASQTVASPEFGGVCGPSDSSERIYLNGVMMPCNYYAYFSTWPVRLESTAYGSKPIMWVSRRNQPSVYANAEGRFTFIPPKSASTLLITWNQYASEEKYVDDENGSLSGTGASDDKYKTIQQALDYAATVSKGIIVHVAPGVYDEGGVTYDGLLNRIKYTATSSSVLIQSEEGPSQTFIVGSTNGTDNVRCAYLNSSSAALQGFTLKDGRSCGDTDNTKRGAAAVGGFIRDCVVTNCTALGYLLEGNNGGNVWRTHIVGNTFQYLNGWSHGWAFNVIENNEASKSLFDNGHQKCQNYSTTIIGNKVPSSESQVAFWCSSFDNCLMDLNEDGFAPGDSSPNAPNLLWNYKPFSGTTWDNFVFADPRLTAADKGDYRPDVLSPAKGAGVAVTDSGTAASGYVYLDADFYGKPFDVPADGKITLGAVQSFNSFCEIAADAGGLAVAGGTVGYAIVPAGTSKTISVSKQAGSTRDVLGVVVAYGNGTVETNLFADLPGGTWSHTVSGNGSSVNVTAYYEPNLYVDAVNGDNANDGWTAATAKKTLANNGLTLVAGDVVHVAPGTYDTETELDKAGAVNAARIVIPEGVAVVASGAQADTVIVGGDKVRCAYMRKNSRLEGFTMTGGYASGEHGSTVYAEKVDKDEWRPRLVNCRLTATEGGLSMLHHGAAYRCTIWDGSTRVSYGAYWTFLYNCRVQCSSGGKTCDSGTIRNSTIIPTFGGVYEALSGSPKCYNSLIVGNVTVNGTYTHCLFATNANYRSTGVTESKPTGCTDCTFTNVEALAVDSSWRPTANSAPIIDQGDNDLVTNSGDSRFDLAGVPRIGNYIVDFGAYEYDDYRAAMKAILGSKVASVDWYSASVVTNADGQVLLDGDGATLEVTKRRDSNLVAGVTITGTGTLTASVNGVAVAALSASGELKIADVGDGDKVTFRFDGEGSAAFGKLSSGLGLTILVR